MSPRGWALTDFLAHPPTRLQSEPRRQSPGAGRSTRIFRAPAPSTALPGRFTPGSGTLRLAPNRPAAIPT